MKSLVIDIHAHFIPKALFARFDAHAAQFPGREAAARRE